MKPTRVCIYTADGLKMYDTRITEIRTKRNRYPDYPCIDIEEIDGQCVKVTLTKDSCLIFRGMPYSLYSQSNG